MDLGEKDDMCDYEKVHRLIESTYKNILKNFNPGVKQLIVLGKALQKTTQNVGASFKAYNECLYELARGAESCKGSMKELGLGLVQLTDSQSEINQHLIDSIKVFHAELLIPLKAKQENEFKHAQVLFDKYLSGHKYHSNNLRKAQTVLERYKKKHKSKPSGQKEMEKTRQMKDCKKKLEEFLRKNLRLALLEERKRYCYLFNRLLYVVEDKVKKYTRAIELLMDGLRNWPELCRSPHILPRLSEQVIHEFGLSEESGDLDDDHSGDEYHSTISHGTTLSLNRRDLRVRGSQRYGWLHADQIKLETSSSTGPGFVGDSTPDDIARKMSAPMPITAPLFDTTAKESPSEVTHVAPTPPSGILCAIYPYVAATEIQLSLEPNDIIRVFGEEQNGWGYGSNIRTNKEGWFPLSFTDFNEDLLHWKSSMLSHHQTLSQTRNASLTNIRNTWHPEHGYDHGRRPSRCSEADVAELSVASAAVAAAATAAAARGSTMPAATTSAITTRASSLRVSNAPSPADGFDQVTVGTKFQARRTLPLEPISEQIPPPQEFRDATVQLHLKVVQTIPPWTVPVKPERTRVGELDAGKRERANPNSNQDFVVSGVESIEGESSTVETPAGNQTKAEVAAENHHQSFAGQRRRNDCFEINLAGSSQPSVLTASLPSPPAATVTPGGVSCSRPPRSPGSPVSTSRRSPGNESGAVQRLEKSNGMHGDAAAETSPSPFFPAPTQPPPPPPPPPSLPPGSYHPRNEYFVRSRVKKEGSVDSTKIS